MRWTKRMLGSLSVAGLLACGDGAATGPDPVTTQPQFARPVTTLVEDVTGTLPGGTFTGTARITRFFMDGDQLMVGGVLNGVATVAGVATNIVNQAFTAPVDLTAIRGSTCHILHLDLGPIFLDLLGLQLDLSRIILDLDAVSGAGNLVGNLLCAVVNLLNGPGGLAGLLNILDRINDLLGGLGL